MMKKLGFPSKWIEWIRGCLESATVSVLVNGSPTSEFKPMRGLRQGDSLASFLFIIVVEGLAGLVRQALKANFLQGMKVGRSEIEICMLRFANDTLFMCTDNYSNVVAIKAILRCYELASRLKINFRKSKLEGLNVDRNFLVYFAKTLNCTQMKAPFKYLGMEVGDHPRKKQFWEPIVNKIKKRLSGWKGRYLSLAGRICLIKSVFTTLPLFYMSFFKAP